MFNEMVAGSFKINPELIFDAKIDQVYQRQIKKMFKVLTSANHSFKVSLKRTGYILHTQMRICSNG